MINNDAYMTGAEVEIFRSFLRLVRPKLYHEIADPRWTDMRWRTLKDSVLGEYNHWTRRITMNAKYRETPEYLVSTLCHELRHQWQHDTMSYKYILACSYLTRRRVLEPTAIQVENAVDRILGMGGLRDGD